jgi:hypothetical protein
MRGWRVNNTDPYTRADLAAIKSDKPHLRHGED